MKEIKQKPAGGKPKTADAARVPKAVVKAAWLQAREAARVTVTYIFWGLFPVAGFSSSRSSWWTGYS